MARRNPSHNNKHVSTLLSHKDSYAMNYISLRSFYILGFALMFILSSGLTGVNEDQFKEIPAGDLITGDEKIFLEAFLISDHEVTNLEYRKFLQFLKINGRETDLKIAQIDTNNWQKYPALSMLTKTYHRHPAFDQYPVVNISYQAATLYCQYLTSMQSDPNYEFILPTSHQWTYSAKGGKANAIYSWGTKSLFNRKGEHMANFKKVNNENLHQDSLGYKVIEEPFHQNNTIVLAPAKSYRANSYGLFNLCGNVAEMTNHPGEAMGGSWNSTGYDVRIDSKLSFLSTSPEVGFRPIKVRTSQK